MSETLYIPHHKGGPHGPWKWTDEFIEQEADALLEYTKKETIPFLKDFAVKRGYYSEAISRYCMKNERFCQALKIYKDKIETQIVYGALAGKLNATFAIFTLKNIAGWRDRQEFEHTGPGGEALSGSAPVNIKIITVESTKSSTAVQVEEPCQTSP